mgnify:CR=1 FL=1
MKKLIALLTAVVMISGCSAEEAPSQTSANTFTVGMECNYAPFNWSDPEANETNVKAGSAYCDGYDVQIAKLIAEDLGKELIISRMDWSSLEPSLNSGEIDAIIAGMTDTPARRENADFTTPYYQSEMVMIVRKDSDLVNATSLQDFIGRNVLGQQQTMYDTVIDQIPNVNHMTPMESYPYMIVSLLNGEADALTAETPVALGAVAANPSLAIVYFEEGQGFQIDPSETAVSIAVKKGNTDLLNSVQSALDNIDQATRERLMEEATSRQPANN